MRNILIIICVLLFSKSFSQSKDELHIKNAMLTQVNAWNKGDLSTYMSTYWKSDSLMFIGRSGVAYGWQNTYDNYKKGYPDQESMGILSFDILQIKRLSVMYFHVVGKWHLKRSEEKGDLNGHFTLLFKMIKNKWVIISDHSS